MSLILADVGAEAFLKARLNNVWPASKDLTLKLFTNDITPLDGHTAADYTEATGGGYVPKTLTAGNWTISTVSGIPQAAYIEQVFTFTGPLTTNPTVFGYYVVDADDVLQWAERLSGEVTPVASGNHIDITPVFQASKGTPS